MDDLMTFMFGGASIVAYVIGFIITAVPFYMLAKKADHEYPWFAFVPLLNVIQYFQVARQSLFLILLLLIPFINFIVTIYIVYKFLKAFGRSGIEILLCIIPIVNLIYLYYLAFNHNIEYELGRFS